MSERAIRRLPFLLRVLWAALRAHSNRAFYDQISPIYESVFRNHVVHIETTVAILEEAYPNRERGTVLELGCGTGLLSKALSGRGFQVTGIDISGQSLRLLQRSDKRVSVVQASTESLPFTDRSFQALICLGVWRHVPHPDAVLVEICRVLKQDGSFVLGYFPPRLGGIVRAPNNAFGKMLVRLYHKVAQGFGYDDSVDPDLETQAWKIVRNKFERARNVKSGQHWHMIVASHPKVNQGKG